MATDKISVQVRFDYVFDFETVCVGFFDVIVYIALRIDHRGFAFRADPVRSVRQAGKIELLEVHKTFDEARVVILGPRASRPQPRAKLTIPMDSTSVASPKLDEARRTRCSRTALIAGGTPEVPANHSTPTGCWISSSGSLYASREGFSGRSIQ